MKGHQPVMYHYPSRTRLACVVAHDVAGLGGNTMHKFMAAQSIFSKLSAAYPNRDEEMQNTIGPSYFHCNWYLDVGSSSPKSVASLLVAMPKII